MGIPGPAELLMPPKLLPMLDFEPSASPAFRDEGGSGGGPPAPFGDGGKAGGSAGGRAAPVAGNVGGNGGVPAFGGDFCAVFAAGAGVVSATGAPSEPDWLTESRGSVSEPSAVVAAGR